MANRVLLGKKGTEYGLWISKPGKDVTTVGVEDLLFSTSSSDYKYSQTLAKGSYTFSSTAGDTFSVTVPCVDNVKPYVIWYTIQTFGAPAYFPGASLNLNVVVNYSFPSNTTCSVQFYKYGSSTPKVGYFITTGEVD
jgi:hypothetical protein